MTKIKNKEAYPLDGSLSGEEYLVGTDTTQDTKSYSLNDIAAFVLDVDPGTLNNNGVQVIEISFPENGLSDLVNINNLTPYNVGTKDVIIYTRADEATQYVLSASPGTYGLAETQITIANLVKITDTSNGLVTSVNGVTGAVVLDLGVLGVSGQGVDNTDPANPIVNYPTALDIDAAPLVNGRVPSQYLPDGVDEIEEYTNYNSFPNPGVENIIYLDLASNLAYRWGGTAYVALNSGATYANLPDRPLEWDTGDTWNPLGVNAPGIPKAYSLGVFDPRVNSVITTNGSECTYTLDYVFGVHATSTAFMSTYSSATSFKPSSPNLYAGAYVLLRFDTTTSTTEPSFLDFDSSLANKVGVVEWGDYDTMDVLIYSSFTGSTSGLGLEYMYLPV
jgi:hypothetical protein